MDNNATELFPLVISCTTHQIRFASSINAVAAKIVITVLNIFISCFGLLANTLVITGYVCSRHVQTIENTMFLFLAITDVGVQPMYVAANISGLFGKRSCILWDMSSMYQLSFFKGCHS